MNKTYLNSVSLVPDHNICTGCGVCNSVCPYDCIDIKIDLKKGVNQSFIDYNVCVDCGVCLKSCPPYTRSNEATNNHLLGNFKSIYACYSADKEIRKQSASGGFITALSVYLLENDFVDGVIVTKRTPDSPINGIPFIAKTKEEIINSKTSIYAPVEFGNIIKKIIKEKMYNTRLAVVGLPCHLEAIHKATNTYKRLNKVFTYKIAILCGQSPSALAYNYISKKLNINKQDIRNIKNRGDGWPGRVTIDLKNDKKIQFPYQDKLSMGTVLSSPLFTPMACQLCVDPVGFNSDITVSDALIDEYANDELGRNFILVRNDKMQSIIDNMILDKAIIVNTHNEKDFYTANNSVINKVYTSHILSKYVLGKKYNDYNTKLITNFSISAVSQIKLYLFSIHIRIISYFGVQKLMKYANPITLFYLKAVNLLKKVEINQNNEQK